MQCVIMNSSTGGGGSYPSVLIKAPSGATVAMSKNGITRTQIVENGQTLFKNVEYGTWSLAITFGGNTQNLTLEVEEQYDINVNFDFLYTIQVDNGADASTLSYVYSDDCADYTPADTTGLNSWGLSPLISYIRPCVIASGDAEPKYYLNKDNYTLKENGEASNLDGSDGDVMVQIKNFYYKLINSGNKITLSISNTKQEDDWLASNLTPEGVEVPYVYIGAYEGTVIDGKLCSVSGQAPTTNLSLTEYTTYAQAKNTNYYAYEAFIHMVVQMLYLMVYADRNARNIFGTGNINTTSPLNTGTTDTKGFSCSGITNEAMKLFGIENFYGNLQKMISGEAMYYSTRYSSGTQIDEYFTGLCHLKRAEYVDNTVISQSVDNSRVNGSSSSGHGYTCTPKAGVNYTQLRNRNVYSGYTGYSTALNVSGKCFLGSNWSGANDTYWANYYAEGSNYYSHSGKPSANGGYASMGLYVTTGKHTDNNTNGNVFGNDFVSLKDNISSYSSHAPFSTLKSTTVGTRLTRA